MNICLMASHLNTGGITSYILNLSRELKKQGHAVWVVSAPGNCTPVLEQLGVRHVAMDIRVKSEVHPKLWMALPGVVRLVKEHKIDVIHANTRVTQVMASVVSKITGAVFVSTCHGFFKPRVFRRLFPCWGKSVIAISRGVREHLIQDFGVDPKQVCLIANGIDIDHFHAVPEVQRQAKREQWRINGSPVIGTIARFSDVKGIDVLLRAVPAVLAQFPRAAIVIAGEGPAKGLLVQLTKELGIGASVRFEPVVNQTAELLPVFDVFVVPSRQEGLGISAMEAQAAGIPVIASAVGGLPDLIEDGRTGVLFPPGDSAALSHKVIALLNAPQEAMAIAGAARQRVEANFSAKQMAESTLDCYEQNMRR